MRHCHITMNTLQLLLNVAHYLRGIATNLEQLSICHKTFRIKRRTLPKRQKSVWSVKSGVWSFGGKSQDDFLFLFAVFLKQPSWNNLRLFLPLKTLYGTTRVSFLFSILRRTCRSTEGHMGPSLRVRCFWVWQSPHRFPFGLAKAVKTARRGRHALREALIFSFI